MSFDAVLAQCKDVIELPAGGQKKVYKAIHPQYGSVVLKKIIHGDSSLSIERLKREIRAVELISSPNVPKIYAHNCLETTTGDFYIIEEYIHGKTIRQLLIEKKVFQLPEIVIFLENMLDTLIQVEKQSIVHRDIKPENLILDSTGKYWLLDFGISRHLSLESITPDNVPFGVCTIGYASSEQFRSLKKDIDIRSDLFSLSVVAVEMLSGRNEYIEGAQNIQTVLKRIENTPVPFIRIKGDGQFQLSAFLRILGDNRQTRRPRTATEARGILETVKKTLDYEVK